MLVSLLDSATAFWPELDVFGEPGSVPRHVSPDHLDEQRVHVDRAGAQCEDSSEVASRSVCSAPQGVVPSRSSDENMCELECGLVEVSQGAAGAPALLLDFATAFPGVGHEWVHRMPECMRVLPLRRVVAAVYTSFGTKMLFRGSVVVRLAFNSGIKQCCLSSSP